MRTSKSCLIGQNKKRQQQNNHAKPKKVHKQRAQIADCHTTPDQVPQEYLRANPSYIEHKKVYEGRGYYKVHFDDTKLDPIYLHRDNGIDLKTLIKDFIARGQSTNQADIGEMEWEVQDILDSVVENGRTKFLVKWKYWIGEPNWLDEDDCDCTTLIAVHENPKLKRIRNFSKNNRNLWVNSIDMQFYVKRLVRSSKFKANVLDSTDDTCSNWPQQIQDGLNIGCTMYDHHWYIAFIFINTNCVTQTILLADSLNTTLVQKIMHHPILVRLKNCFPTFPIRPIKMTQMDRSDMCAFYALAAIERGLFLFNRRAKFIAETVEFHPTRAEYLRSKYAPNTDLEISLSLKSKLPVFACPTCPFCRRDYDDFKNLDSHIERNHFYPGTTENGSSQNGRAHDFMSKSFNGPYHVTD